MTVLLTTHLLDEADRCDRLAILDRGKLIREGTPSDLKAAIGGEVVTLDTTAPDEVSAALAEEFSVSEPWVEDRRIRFAHPDGSQWAARLMERFGSRIDSVKVSRPSLEDVFFRYAGHDFESEDSPTSEETGSKSD